LYYKRKLPAEFFLRNRWPGVWDWYIGKRNHFREERYRKQVEWAVKLSRELYEQDVPHVFLKAVPAEQMFYGGIGLRKMADIDLLVARRSVPIVNKVFDALRFDKGIVVAGRGFRRLSRAEEVIRLLHSHEAVPRILNPTEEDKRIEFDINFAFAWKAIRADIDVDLVLQDASSIVMQGHQLPVLSPPWMCLHTMLHAYAEATMFLCTSKTWTADKVHQDSFRLDNIYEASQLQSVLEPGELDALTNRFGLAAAGAYARGVLQYFETGHYVRSDIDYFWDLQGKRWQWKTEFSQRIVSGVSSPDEVREILTGG
jgi:hypothetical protein